MSWSTRSMAWPPSTERAQATAQLLALVGVEAGGRLVQADTAGLCDERARDPDQLALSLRRARRVALGDRLEPEQVAGRGSTSPEPAPGGERSPGSSAAPTGDGRRRAGSRAPSGRRRARSTAMSARARCAPACGGRPGSSARRRARPVPVSGRSRDRVDEGRLAGAVGPIRPTSRPGPTSSRRR